MPTDWRFCLLLMLDDFYSVPLAGARLLNWAEQIAVHYSAIGNYFGNKKLNETTHILFFSCNSLDHAK